MPFTAAELANIANGALDYFVRGGPLSQVIQEKPLLDALTSKQTTFPGGKEFISLPVKGVYTTSISGYEHDDVVPYRNPANLKRARYPWKEHHAGIELTFTELKKDGISVVDTNGENTTEHSEREMTAITDIFKDKLEDMAEGWAISTNLAFWRDGTADPKLVPGLRSFILNSPSAAGTTAGIDRTANTWWRNRAQLAMTATTASDQNVVQTIQKESRQLRRYRGKPDLYLAGADFLDWLEKELRSKGNYTLDGWAKGGKIDFSVDDVAFKGQSIQYDPTLDDEGLTKYMFTLDTRRVYLKVMEDEDRKTHEPSRPHDQYVMFRGMTWTGGLVCDQLNANEVFSIA